MGERGGLRYATRMKHLALFAVLVSTLGVACAVTPEPAPAGDAERLYADVAWLADDAREGRRAGTQGGLDSAFWIAQRMQEIGLEPAGEAADGDGGWFQDFEVGLEPRAGGGSFVETTAGQKLIPRIDEAADVLSPLFCSSSGEAEGPLVYCGYGIVDESRGWDDFAGLPVDGAIVLICRGVPGGDKPTGQPASRPASRPTTDDPDDTAIVGDAESWGGSATVFMKVMNAKRRGAAGVILMPDLQHMEQEFLSFGKGGSARAGIPCLALNWFKPPAGGNSGFSPPRLWQLAEKPKGHAELVRANRPEMFEDGQPVLRIFADVQREKGPARNVLGLLRGNGTSDETVVIGAHYDHLGHGGSGSLASDGTREVHNGADDNASGTAAALEIARVLKETGPHDRDVLIALWSGEELGLLGSEHWGQNPTVPLERVTCNLNLDMVGRAGDGKLTVLGAGTSPAFVRWLAAAERGTGLELMVNASGQGVGGSDHQTFLKRQIPALHLFSGLHADYHRPTDDIDGFEAEGTARVVQLSVGLVERMLAADEIAYVEPAPDENERKIESGFRAWFGSIPEYGFEGPGVLFGGISSGSPAEKAGLLPGDVLLGLGDVEIETIYDFTYALQTYKAGDVVTARFRRDGELDELQLTLATRGVR